MQKQLRYPAHKSIPVILDSAGVSTKHVLKRANLPSDLFDLESRGMTAEECCRLWDAIFAEADDPELTVKMARKVAQGPFVPAAFAFSCSPNIVTGLERLAVFKPLIAPLRLIITKTSEQVTLEIDVAEPGLKVPGPMAAFEMVYFLELGRTFSGVDFVPQEVGLPALLDHQYVFDRYFERKAAISRLPRLVLSKKDAHRALISENPQLWSGFEAELRRQLAERKQDMSMSAKVRNALLELLPAGQASVDAVCDRLVTSRRSLQRHLNNEGITFQSILDRTRSDLSLHYLRQGDMSVEEISYLLAYRDPNSFYRAFQNWTGRTPGQMRGELRNSVI